MNERTGQLTENLSDKDRIPEQKTQISEQQKNTVETLSKTRVFKIQILASTKKLPAQSKELKGYKADYYVEGKFYKYTYGESSDWNEIENLRKKISKDFKEAFIVTFENGVKVPNK